MAAVDAKLDPRLEAKDSRSTLVEEVPRFERSETPHAQSPAPATPASPFSASFDPNGPIPQTPQGILSPATTLSQRPSMPASQDAWTSSVAASLNSLASQFAAASTALATVPIRPNSDVQESFPALTMIEQAQSRLKDELETLREQVAHLMESGRRPEKEKEREKVEIPAEDYEMRLQAVEKKVDELGEAIRLECVVLTMAWVRRLTRFLPVKHGSMHACRTPLSPRTR